MARAAETGSVDDVPPGPATPRTPSGSRFATTATTPTLQEFVDSTCEASFMPGYKPSTQRRYRDLFRQGLLDELGTVRLDALGANDYRVELPPQDRTTSVA